MSTHGDDSGTMPDDLVAAEFVLGVLDVESWQAAEARRIADPAFAAIVADWEHRLADLADAVPSVPAPARVHRRVEAELSLLIARMPPPEPEPEPEPPPPPKRGIPFWRRLAIGGGVLSAASIAGLAGVLFLPHSGVQSFLPRSVDVATLVPGEVDHVLFFVAIDHERQEVLLTPVGVVPADRVPELWYVADGSPPRSLGVFSGALPRVLPLPSLDGLRESTRLRGVRLAVSLEPPGGSPDGSPSGHWVAEGLLVPAL